MKLEISVLASGSSGNSIYIGDGKNNILIDAGLSGKKIERRLKMIDKDPECIDAILVTHEHCDHIKGVGVLSRRFNIPIYANDLTWQGAIDSLGKITEENCRIFKEAFMIGEFAIDPFSIPHDANDPVGFIVNYKNKKIGIATDMGYMPERVKDKLKKADFLVIESNHDLEMLMNGSYPWSLKNRIRGEKGHLSNDDTAAILPELISDNCPSVLLAHLSKDNNNPDVAYITIKNILEKEGLQLEKDVKMNFTYRDKPTQLYNII